MRRLRLLCLTTIVIVSVACGSDSPTPSPSTPAPPAPAQPVQVAGIWTMAETRTSVSGGECLEGTMQGTIGSSVTDTLTFTQTGTALTAVTTAPNGVSCNWTGTADVGRFVLNLSFCQTNASTFGLRCSNGASRDLRVASGVISAQLNANGTYSGTKADTFSVVPAGSFTQVGTMTFNENVSISK